MVSLLLWLIALFLALLALSWHYRYMLVLAEGIPGPRIWPCLGNAILFMSRPGDQLSLMAEQMKKYGQYVKLWLGPTDLNIIVGDPADIRRLLSGNKVIKKGPAYEYMKPFIGPGILSGGPTWRSHRKIANLSYNKKAVQHHAKTSNKYAIELAKSLCTKDPNVTFNVYHDVVKYTTFSVCDQEKLCRYATLGSFIPWYTLYVTTSGEPISLPFRNSNPGSIMGLSEKDIGLIRGMDAIVNESHDIYEFLYSNMTYWWFRIPPIYWLSGRKSRERRYKKNVELMTSDIVNIRKEALKKEVNEESMAVVDRFILSGDMTEQEIKWETMTFFTASQEATAKIASTVLLIFAHHQDWQEKVYEEIQEILGPKECVLDEDLKKLSNLDIVYKEAVRYMPIGAVIQRTAEEDLSVNDGKYTIPEGASILFPIHLVHRDPRYWEEPNKIKPERFSTENSKNRDPNVFLPFSLGPMDCIGRVYAESLVKLIAIQVLRRVQLEADGSIEDLEVQYAISAKFAKGYNLRARPRSLKIK